MLKCWYVMKIRISDDFLAGSGCGSVLTLKAGSGSVLRKYRSEPLGTIITRREETKSPGIVKLLQQVIDGDPAEQSLVQLRHNLDAAIVEPRGG